MNEKLLNKIKGLLAHANCKSVTEEESKSFLDKATELMTKHGLEMSDLPADAAERQIQVGEERVSVGRKREYELAVGHVLKECFGVKVLHAGSINYCFFLIGTPEDVAMAKEILPMLRATMSRGFIAWQKRKGITKWSSAEARAYYWGLAKGYIHASEEGKARAMAQASKEQQQAFGLILVDKDKAITLWMGVHHPNVTTIKENKTGSDNGAHTDGFVQGATLKLVQPKKLS